MKTHTEQLGIRLPRETYKELKREAVQQRPPVSLSQYIRQIIEARHANDKPAD